MDRPEHDDGRRRLRRATTWGTLRRGSVAMTLAIAAAGCGDGTGGIAPSESARAFVRKLAAAAPGTERVASVAPGVDAEALLDWAEWKFPTLFPKGPATVDIEYLGVAYAVRSYVGGNHLGVSRQGEVWGLGGYTAGQLRSFGPVAQYAGQVAADRCSVYADRCAAPTALDLELRALIAREGLTGDPTVGRNLPSIADAMPQLGKLLFFSKSLSVGRDVACASCHHPALGGGDGLGVSIGAQAQNPDVLGPGRMRADRRLLVARNANTFFNTALYDRVLFADGRIESLAATPSPGGQGDAIRTPDGAPDPRAGASLLAAQARFPITGSAEMRGDGLPGLGDHELREHIAARLAAEAAAQPEGTGWLPHFRKAFGRPQGSAAELITFDHIMQAIAEYERSAVFVKSPWQRYVLGENLAIGVQAKKAALRYFRPVSERGFECARCHKGDFHSDERFHPIGFPQTGPGFALDGVDEGRQRVSAAAADRYAFRTPSLLNIEVTAPYGHAGSYGGLFFVTRHYRFESVEVRDLVQGRTWCRLSPFREQTNCAAQQAVVGRESFAAMDAMQARRRSDPANGLPSIDGSVQAFELAEGIDGPTMNAWLEEFLATLTDPCVKDRACLARWIPRPDEAPDAHQLNAVDISGRAL